MCAEAERGDGLQTFHLTRYRGSAHREWSAWLQSDEAADGKLMERPDFLEGQYLTTRARRDDIASARLADASATGDGSVTTTYCYRGGRLARLTTQVFDVSDEMAWTRVRYFDGERAVADTVAPHDLAKKRVGTAPPTPRAALDAPVALKANRLPFYGAFRAALAGTLRSLR